MNTRHMRRGLLILALMGVFGGGMLLAQDAHAWSGWCGRQHYEELKPEMQNKYDAIMKGYHEKMSPLTEKMMARRLELDALTGNANADPKRITALAEEIAALRTQIRNERFKLGERLKSEVGIDMRMGYDGDRPGRGGPGHGGRGHGGPDGRGGWGKDCGPDNASGQR